MCRERKADARPRVSDTTQATPPTTAAVSKTLTTSNGRTYSPKSMSASAFVEVQATVPVDGHVVSRTAAAITTAMMTAATAAAQAWVWKTSRLGAFFV